MAFAESGGQPTALGAVVERTRVAGVVLDADIDPDVAHLDSMRRLAVLRVVQEGLTNVVRHAGRHPRAALTVVADRDGVRIAVTDDGPGARRADRVSGWSACVSGSSCSAAGSPRAGTAENGYEAVRLVTRLAPDVVLMDLRMPGVDGITATARITASHPASACSC